MPLPRVIAALLASVMLAAACGSPADDDAAGEPSSPAAPSAGGANNGGTDGEALRARLVSDLAPGDAATVGQAVNAFGFELLGELADGDENVVTSPVSVATMLAMLLAGAEGDTAAAMADVLRLESPRDVRVGALLDQLAGGDDVTLSVANGLWPDDSAPLNDDYLTFVQDIFGATADEADLGSAETAEEIDAWVDEHTEGLIPTIAEDLGLPDPSAALALVNAVYFLGEWTTQFDPERTQNAPFRLADGSRVQAPLMQLNDQELGHVKRDGYEMLRLPYGEQGRFAMEVLLPDQGSSLPALLGALDAAEWRAAIDALAPQKLGVVALPTFELEWQAELSGPLQELGMGAAFDADADFGAMSPDAPGLDTVVHKTYIRVDEKGTEAAAVTGGVTRTSAEPAFVVDRPFAFTISDQQTGTVLFLGAVADPRG